MTKKGYQKKLPTIVPPAPRAAPALESSPSGRGAGSVPETIRAEARPAAAATAQPASWQMAPTQPEPRPTATSPSRVLVSAAMLLGLVAGGLAWWTFLGDGDGADDRPASRPAAGLPTRGWPKAGESRAVTQVRPDGVLEVTHWIHASEPLDRIDLVLPEGPQGGSIEIAGVEVVADRQRVAGPSELTSDRGWFFADATRIRVRYELSGAVELSASAPGRGLATTTALEVSPSQQRDTRVVRSEAVLSLACAAAPGALPEPCGASDRDDQWRVELTGQDAGARVVAAVTVSP